MGRTSRSTNKAWQAESTRTVDDTIAEHKHKHDSNGKTTARPFFHQLPYLVKVDEGLRAGKKASQVLPQVGQKTRVGFPAELSGQGTAETKNAKGGRERSDAVTSPCHLPRACQHSGHKDKDKDKDNKKPTTATATAARSTPTRRPSRTNLPRTIEHHVLGNRVEVR